MKLINYLLMFVVIGMIIPSISIIPDQASASGTYDYKVSSNVVLDSSGRTVYTGTSFTVALNWALSHANTVTYVPAGTYALTAHVYFGTGTTLIGDGDSTLFTATSSHFFYINGVSHVTLSSFKFTGHLQIYGYKAGGTCGDWTFTDIHATLLTGDMEAGFWMYVGENGIIDGIEFTHCSVTYSQTYGFLLFGDDNAYVGNSLIKNVFFTDCEASHNGNDNIGWINAWITGFDLVECTSVENIILTRCIANYNWCSGFHVEYGAKPKNIVLIDCVSNYNGQRPNCPQYYGYGFKFQNFQVPGVSCVNLIGIGNYEGFCPIAMTATSLNMKTWLNPTNGKASTGSWHPAGVPDATSDLIFTKLGSNTNCVVDTNRKSVRNLYYYSGSITYATPVPGTVPSAPTNLAATLTAGKIALSWTAPANNGGSAITSYSIYRGTASGSESTTAIGSSTTLSYTDSNVVAGTSYYYLVKAVNSAGTSVAGNEASYSVPSSVPSAPTNLAATLTAGKIALSWTAPANNGGSAITSYSIYRGTASGSESTTAIGSSTTLSYTDSNVVAGTSYYYLVKAVNSAGTSVASNEASYSVPSSVPSAPTNLAATLTAGKIALSWTAPANNGGSAITSYSIYRGTASGSESTTAIGSSTTLSYTDSNVVAGTSYYYLVKAVNSAGTSVASNEASYSVPSSVPSAPTNLAATLTAGKIALSWTAPANNGGSAITSYSIYRGTASGSESTTAIGSSTTLSYTDSNVVAGTSYYYLVKAVNSAGTSVASNEASYSVPSSVPSAPTNLAATLTAGKIALSWTAPANNGGSAITSYSIYRGTASGSESTTAIGSSTTLSYTDSNVVAGTSYYYLVKAVNSAGTSVASNEASYSVPSSVPSAPTNLAATLTAGKIALSWTAPVSSGSSPVSIYWVYRGMNSALTDQVSIASVLTTSFIDIAAPTGTYHYTVKAVNSIGFSEASLSISMVVKDSSTVPGTVDGVSIIGSDGLVTLTWSAPDNGGLTIIGYNVYQSTASSTETLLATLGPVLNYTDTGLTNGQVYSYRVSAVNDIGEGELSSEVSATPGPNKKSSTPGAFALTATQVKAGVILRWTTPSNGGSQLLNFQILKTKSGVEDILATLAPSKVKYIDFTAKSGNNYSYRIVAVNSIGSSSTLSINLYDVLAHGVKQNGVTSSFPSSIQNNLIMTVHDLNATDGILESGGLGSEGVSETSNAMLPFFGLVCIEVLLAGIMLVTRGNSKRDP